MARSSSAQVEVALGRGRHVSRGQTSVAPGAVVVDDDVASGGRRRWRRRLRRVLEAEEIAQLPVDGVAHRDRIAGTVRIDRAREPPESVARDLEPEARAGLIERRQRVAGGEERHEAPRALAEPALVDRAPRLHAQAIPRRQEEVPHRVRARHRALTQHVDQLAARVEQDVEQLVPHGAVGRRETERLHDEDEERVPAVDAVLPRRDLGVGQLRLGRGRGGLGVRHVHRDLHADAVGIGDRLDRPHAVERGQDGLRAVRRRDGTDERLRLVDGRAEVEAERAQPLGEAVLHRLERRVRERARIAVGVARFHLGRLEAELPVAPDDGPREIVSEPCHAIGEMQNQRRRKPTTVEPVIFTRSFPPCASSAISSATAQWQPPGVPQSSSELPSAIPMSRRKAASRIG